MKQNFNNTCFTSSYEKVYSWWGTYQYAQFYSINDRHSVSDSLESSQKRYSFIGLQHPSSSAIHKQPSLHARLFIWQKQLRQEVLSSELKLACHCPTSIHFLLARGHSEVTLELCSKQKLESLLSQYDDKDILMWEEGPHSSDSSGTEGNIGPHLHSQSFHAGLLSPQNQLRKLSAIFFKMAANSKSYLLTKYMT